MSFSKYMNLYKSRLTDLNTLEEMLNEATRDYRLQKLLVLYMVKDKKTFKNVLELSNDNPFAKKLIEHAQIALNDLKNSNSFRKRRLAKKLIKTTNLLNHNKLPRTSIETWERVGYSKMFNNYLVTGKKKNLKPHVRQKVEKKLAKVDWDNLIIR